MTKSNGTTLREMAADPAAFRAALLIDTDEGPRRLADACDPWQRADFESLDPAWRRIARHDVRPSCGRAYLERPRGHSKTADLAAMATWALAFSRGRLSGVAAAADKDQAKLLRDAVARLVALNPWLAETLDVQQYKVRNTRTDSELSILSSDAPTSYGLTPDFLLVDELTHWQGRDLWDALISAAAKRRDCLVVVISNAGFGETWQWELRETIRTDPNWHYSRLDGPCASWITQDRLAEQRRLLPDIAYRRLWLNQWTEGSGDALTTSDIDGAIMLPGPTVVPERGWVHVAGLDLGLKRDASALCVLAKHVGYSETLAKPQPRRSSTTRALLDLGLLEPPAGGPEPSCRLHEGTGRVRLVDTLHWRPGANRVEIAPIESAILDHHQRFNLSALFYDPWQSEFLAERLRKQGVYCEPVPFTGPNLTSMAGEMLRHFAERTIELYEHDELLQDLRALRVAERGYGVRLRSPKDERGHGDCATALAIGLHGAKRIIGEAAAVAGPLVCYP